MVCDPVCDAGTYVPCSDRVNPHISQERKRRPVTHYQAVSKTAGSDFRYVQCNTFWPDHPARGLWSGRNLTWHINCLEMLAVFRALKHFLPNLRDHHVLVRADILSRQGLKPGEWMLHPEAVKQIWRVLGLAQVDLFVTRKTSHCPLWLSLTHPAQRNLKDILIVRIPLIYQKIKYNFTTWTL